MRRPRAHKQRLHNFPETLQYVKKQGLLREKTHSQSIAAMQQNGTNIAQENVLKGHDLSIYVTLSHLSQTTSLFLAIWRAKNWHEVGFFIKNIKCSKDNSGNK